MTVDLVCYFLVYVFDLSKLSQVSEVPFKQAWRPPFVVQILSSKEIIRFLEKQRQILTRTCKHIYLNRSSIEK